MPSSVIFEQPDKERMVRLGRECTARGIIEEGRMVRKDKNAEKKRDEEKEDLNLKYYEYIIYLDQWSLPPIFTDMSHLAKYVNGYVTYINQSMVSNFPTAL